MGASADRPLELQGSEVPTVRTQLAHEGGKLFSPMHQLTLPP